MKLIETTAFTDAMFVSSTAPETDYAVWAFGTFAVGNRRILTTAHKIYECLVAHTSTDATGSPDLNLTGATPKWLEVSATNQRMMFDNVVGTSTTIASPLTVVLKPGFIGGLGLLELVGTQATISLRDATAGTVVYTKTVSLDNTPIEYFADWFFTDFVQLSEFALTDLPDVYSNPELTITITGSGSVQCGVCKFGRVFYVGDTENGSSIGITDYSVKVKDAFGRYTVVERTFSKRGNYKVVTDKSRFSTIFRRLAALRAKLCIYIATDAPGYEPMIVYGYFKDLNIEANSPLKHRCNLEIEGVI